VCFRCLFFMSVILMLNQLNRQLRRRKRGTFLKKNKLKPMSFLIMLLFPEFLMTTIGKFYSVRI